MDLDSIYDVYHGFHSDQVRQELGDNDVNLGGEVVDEYGLPLSDLDETGLDANGLNVDEEELGGCWAHWINDKLNIWSSKHFAALVNAAPRRHQGEGHLNDEMMEGAMEDVEQDHNGIPLLHEGESMLEYMERTLNNDLPVNHQGGQSSANLIAADFSFQAPVQSSLGQDTQTQGMFNTQDPSMVVSTDGSRTFRVNWHAVRAMTIDQPHSAIQSVPSPDSPCSHSLAFIRCGSPQAVNVPPQNGLVVPGLPRCKLPSPSSGILHGSSPIPPAAGAPPVPPSPSPPIPPCPSPNDSTVPGPPRCDLPGLPMSPNIPHPSPPIPPAATGPPMPMPPPPPPPPPLPPSGPSCLPAPAPTLPATAAAPLPPPVPPHHNQTNPAPPCPPSCDPSIIHQSLTLQHMPKPGGFVQHAVTHHPQHQPADVIPWQQSRPIPFHNQPVSSTHSHCPPAIPCPPLHGLPPPPIHMKLPQYQPFNPTAPPAQPTQRTPPHHQEAHPTYPVTNNPPVGPAGFPLGADAMVQLGPILSMMSANFTTLQDTLNAEFRAMRNALQAQVREPASPYTQSQDHLHSGHSRRPLSSSINSVSVPLSSDTGADADDEISENKDQHFYTTHLRLALPPPTDEEIKVFKNHMPNCIQITPENFRFDLNHKQTSPFNNCAKTVAAVEFLKRVKDDHYFYPPIPSKFLNQDYVVFMLHGQLKHLIRIYKELQAGPSKKTKRLIDTSWTTRKHQLYDSRLDVASSDPNLSRHVPLLKKFGISGISSDEGEGPQGLRKFKVLTPAWRSGALSGLYYQLDERCAVMRRVKEGHNMKAKVPPKLPLNCYDQEWYNSLQPDECYALGVNVEEIYPFKAKGKGKEGEAPEVKT
ncbi:hypothetical protein BDN67DRAFT_1017428 [Paxillus ammoniavirescens]|nr:hypothetical protein BDN67DRAFT_1017428 [Paxillus ammoniavirescens]